MFAKQYAEVFGGDANWNSIHVPHGDLYAWSDKSTYIKRAPYFDEAGRRRSRFRKNARAGACWAIPSPPITFRRPEISPSTAPAGKYLISLGVKPADFNSYGARRGNHEVMVRGTLANVRLRNQMAPGTEGGWTTHLPSNERMFIYDAAMKYRDEGVPADDHRRQGIRQRVLARLGRERRPAAGRARGDRRKFRADSSLEPGRHGRAPARIRGRTESRIVGADRA